MNRTRSLVILAVVVLAGAGAWYYFRAGHESVAIDLIKEFPTAKERKPNPESFSVIQATINGVTKPAIFTKDLTGTRITWEKTIPDNAWLKVDIGLLEEAWKQQGDGVLFRIGVSVGSTYDPLLTLQLNPFSNAADRKWNEMMFDLSQYAGQTVNIHFNTNSSPPGADDRNGDLAVWGDPRVIVK